MRVHVKNGTMNKKQLIIAHGILISFIFLAHITGVKWAYAEKFYHSSIDSFLFAVFYNDKDKLQRWDSNVVGVRVYGATEDEERMMNEICELLSSLTDKPFKRYYSEDIIVEFDNYFNKQMYGDDTIGISYDHETIYLKINRIKIDHNHPNQYKIALHELLHAIGYKRHSLNPYSIMFSSILPNQVLIEEDIQIIKMLYDPNLNLRNGMTYDEVYEILYGWK